MSLVAIDDNGLSSEVLKCNYIYYPTSTTDSDTQDGADSVPNSKSDRILEINS